MKKSAKIENNSNGNKNGTNGFLPSSLKFISSCIKTASSGVRSASASVAASLSGDPNDHKDQVLWASFDKLEVEGSTFRYVLLLGYANGFQVLDVDDAGNVSELVSRRDDLVTFLQIQPLPIKKKGVEGFTGSHPLLLVVADETKRSPVHLLGGQDGLVRDGHEDPTRGLAISPTTVRFYSLRSHNYVHVLRFRSTVYMVRCSPRIVAVALATQIYCFDALTLENKFSVLTYPVPHMGGQGTFGVNVGYGPMAVGARWLGYASNSPLASNVGRLSPQNLTPPCVSPSTSPSSGNQVARLAMESGKQIAAGLINLGDRGYKTLSKYCQELKTDGTGSPVSSSGWKVGRAVESDIAGMVVVKDFVSRAVVSQFRAHTSPISALCFDPSGTLLVTASIYGNNINIFRIMPSCSKNNAGTQGYDWSSSHVHLYKLHRGVTSAVIQDICFSPYSQWVAIVSSKGTCHIFVLSPFGGENVLQLENSHVDGPILSPAVSLPWWSSPSFSLRQFSSPPPAPVTLSVVSRIKNSNSGWLNTVSHAATSAVGKATISSGALAAVFHRSVSSTLQPSHSKIHDLEYILAYTPSGHVVQYKLLPSLGCDAVDSTSRMGSCSSAQMLEEELRVKVEAVQGWDVCRRTDWPEREESISGLTLAGLDIANMNLDAYDLEDNEEHKEMVKPPEKSHLYLANAEVQIRSGRIPIWQNPKMSFYAMDPLESDVRNINGEQVSGEIGIEEVPVHEVEIRRKDLLPVFDHLHGVYSYKTENRAQSVEAYSVSPTHSHGGSSKVSYPLIQTGNDKVGPLTSSYMRSLNGYGHFISIKQPVVSEPHFHGSMSPSTNGSPSGGGTVGKELQPSNVGRTSEGSYTSSNRSDLSMNVLDEGPVDGSPNFEQFFKEEYYKTSSSSDPQEQAQVVETESNNGSCDKEKLEEDVDEDDDDMLGGVFAFSEEG